MEVSDNNYFTFHCKLCSSLYRSRSVLGYFYCKHDQEVYVCEKCRARDVILCCDDFCYYMRYTILIERKVNKYFIKDVSDIINKYLQPLFSNWYINDSFYEDHIIKTMSIIQ